MVRVMYYRIYIFSLLTLKELFKFEDISITVQEDDIAKTLLCQGQGTVFFISQTHTRTRKTI